ncbi:unnamed protein product [Camellia sinensis]
MASDDRIPRVFSTEEFLLTRSRSLGHFFGIVVGSSRSGLLCLKSGSSCLALLVGRLDAATGLWSRWKVELRELKADGDILDMFAMRKGRSTISIYFR